MRWYKGWGESTFLQGVPRILPIVKSIYKSGENRDPPRKKMREKFGCAPIRSYIYGVELKKQLKSRL